MAEKEKKTSGMEMVRQALAALGEDAKPKAIDEWIKTNFNGAEVKNISVNKSNLKKAGDKKPATKETKTTEEAPKPKAKAAEPATATASSSDFLTKLQTVNQAAKIVGGFKELEKIAALMARQHEEEEGSSNHG